MITKDGTEVNIGDKVWIAGFEHKDTFYKPIRKQLKPNYKIFYADFQNCVEYCKLLNSKK